MSLIVKKESGSKNKYDFDAWRNTGTFLGALDYMLQVIYSGEYASEIWHCFRMSDKYQPSYRYCSESLFSDGEKYSGHVLTDEEQIHATYYADKANAMLNFLLQLHYMGKSNSHIENQIDINGFTPSEEIIQEMITIAERRSIGYEFCEEKKEWEDIYRNEISRLILIQQHAYNFEYFTSTFLRALGHMLRKFLYFGASTQETKLLFLDMRCKFLCVYLWRCSFSTLGELVGQGTYLMACTISKLKLLLQLHHIGKDTLFIQAKLHKLGDSFSEELIQELITIAKKPDQEDPMWPKLREDGPEKESVNRDG